MGVTVKQIASELGLSAATVSMALNQKPGIGEETRKLVLNKAKELNYTKGSAQKACSTPVQRSIHFILFHKNNELLFHETPFFRKILETVETTAHVNGYQLRMSNFYKDQPQGDQMHTLSASGCDGVLILATEMDEESFRVFEKLQTPTLILDNCFTSDICDMVSIDNEGAIAAAFQYLTAQGHTNIGYLTVPVDFVNYQRRKEAYLQLLRSSSGFVEMKKMILKVPYWNENTMRALEQHITNNRNLPTAFLADNDVAASSMIRMFQKCGYRVPEDISIIGFDDIPEYQLANPALTTLSVDPCAMARLAVERLVSKLDDPEHAGTACLSLRAPLVVRRSVCRRLPRL